MIKYSFCSEKRGSLSLAERKPGKLHEGNINLGLERECVVFLETGRGRY